MEDDFKNPDPNKYVIRIRNGKPILVDKQVIRWTKKRREERAVQAKKEIDAGKEDDSFELLKKSLFE